MPDPLAPIEARAKAATPLTEDERLYAEASQGCLTGDCPHSIQAECDAFIREQLILAVGDNERLRTDITTLLAMVRERDAKIAVLEAQLRDAEENVALVALAKVK